ncbi:SDR family NAD(P)-dependent oxidoreductase [Streptacidiphilus fuscans]|uniref:SDR family oxidoreductase n=1 Tax=Streptacidiphilus fuscans TaxID=2789292 RepID=A0A931BCR4_9ACTN|nr:SDR family oxidoreductase [Streptacidiphilus fuscans]MBF9071646.1 SDR family oxidoreductase [Streptacidiphilus fuscans]MBF9072867.1 SDR family oxidoreductase [Streptacidiphilus fuscans]
MARTVVVTGGSSGIGRAVAARFVAEGDGTRVFVTGRRKERLDEVAAELGVTGVVCDGTDPAAVARLAEQVREQTGEQGGERVDVLVNAAGGLASTPEGGGLLEQWEAMYRLNVMTAVLTTDALKDQLVAGSTVISIGTIGAERRGGSYGAAKAALQAWNGFLSAELGPRGVTANVVSCGYIADTEFFQGAMTPERHAALVAETHNGRPGTPADVAETIHFLASPGARHITGQTLHVNGGAFTTR